MKSIGYLMQINYRVLKKLQKISESLNIFLRDLLPIYNDYQVKILKYDESKKWLYPSKEKNKYEFTELAGVKKLPISRALELLITSDKVSEDVFLETTATSIYL